MTSPLLRTAGITKRFPGVNALVDVDFDIRAGEVHCLVGENGAGKSTFIKILAGAQRPDAGQIWLKDREVEIHSPRQAKELGLAFIFQELSVVGGLTVAENIVLGAEPGSAGRYDRRTAVRLAEDLLASIGFGELSPSRYVSTLSPAERQAVMIAKALNGNSELICMDEPTSPLEEKEVRRLFDVIATLKARGKAILYVSHKMREIEELGDRITVFKDGRKVTTVSRGEVTPHQLINLMVGRELGEVFPPKDRKRGETLLKVEGLSNSRLADVSFSVAAGEIVGIAGLVGSGRTELLRAIFGGDRRDGQVSIAGQPLGPASIPRSIGAGLGLVPEERRSQGIIGVLDVGENALMVWRDYEKARRLTGTADSVASQLVDMLGVKTPSLRQRISLLSGGNQQKVVLSKWLAMQTRVLLLDEPTRGVDVGAKREIYEIIDRLAREGMAIVLVSSELPELLGLADRLIVLNGGRKVGELPGTASESDVIALSMLHAA